MSYKAELLLEDIWGRFQADCAVQWGTSGWSQCLAIYCATDGGSYVVAKADAQRSCSYRDRRTVPMAPERLPGFDKLAPVDSLREVNNRQSPFNTGKTSLTGTSWRNVEDQSMTRTNVLDIFANRLAVVRDRAFLSPGECQKLLAEVRSHEFVRMAIWQMLCLSDIQ